MAGYRILCVRSDRIGDMLVSTPVFRRLRQLHPDAFIDVIASPLGAVALEGNPDISAVHIYDKKHPFSFFRLAPVLLTRHDLIVNFNGRSRTAGLITVLARGGRKGAFNVGAGMAPWSGNPEDGNHYSAVMLRELEAGFGLPHDEAPSIRIRFVIPEAVDAEVRNEFPKGGERRRVGIFIGNIKKVGPRWPIGKFVRLTDLLLRQQEAIDVWVVAGADDVPLLDAYKTAGLTGLRLFIAGKSLQRTGAFLRTCDAFVTCSSAPQHLAGAMGTPTVSITYPWAGTFWAPRGPLNTTVVSKVDGDVRAIPVREVYEALQKTLGGMLLSWDDVNDGQEGES